MHYLLAAVACTHLATVAASTELASRRGGELRVKPSRRRVAHTAATRRAPCAAVKLHNDKPLFVPATR
jgi:hypothetical protein